MTPSLVVLGARGFVGRALIRESAGAWSIKAVSRREVTAPGADGRVRWYQSELTDSDSLAKVFEPGDVIVNLAFDATGDVDRNLALADGIVRACRQAGVARLLHCSTALVLGRSPKVHVRETTLCAPQSEYERIKWDVERRMAIADGLEVVIIRPTVVIGPGGRNLAAFADALRRGAHVASYLRSCLYGRRSMHLVPVRHVAAAILYLAAWQGSLDREIFLVSADDEMGNDYQTVDAVLREGLGVSRPYLPRLMLPQGVLRAVLALRGRSDTMAERIYDASKLRGMGFTPPQTVIEAVREVGASFRGPR